MDWTLEVVVVPVSDLARSIAFYRDQVGLDHPSQLVTASRNSPSSIRRTTADVNESVGMTATSMRSESARRSSELHALTTVHPPSSSSSL
ncbi:glyoxalase/bleomycin resistance protein/dioxygenase superfamily protein [Labedella gwakjiensis]|uniref:Glyoxalase/bleomycin resistance protein/dioxygenase superfamily protein n=1 Tax=Labedella gwakjiensis TaxID=390269 RepID=A0A2P8GW08_9MICO|nr:glyoxalase/bleomycin resistance protein/dioxygenase superfamily protein [Labedella gwakjiensis]